MIKIRDRRKMPQKRQQREEDLSGSETLSSSKRCKSTAAAPDCPASRITASHLNPITDSELNSTASLSWGATSAVHSGPKALPKNHSAHSRLIPRGERRTARSGQKDETLLRLLCDDTITGEVKELHFRNMPHSSIDWNDAAHIHKINNWRNQIYGRAGLKSKAVSVWLPYEELWFELYFQLSIAESRMHGILLPKNARVLKAFNSTFVGHSIRDQNGNYTAPRAARQENAFASKFNRMCPNLRARLQQCTFGKSGDIFVPEISLEMLHAYRQMKIELEGRGIKEECVYSEHLQEWCHLFAHLPGTSHVTIQKKQLSMAEDDAAAVLISLSQEHAKSEGEDDVLKNSEDGADYKAPEDPSTSSMQYSTATWNKHDNVWSSTERPSFSSSTTSSQKSDTPVTPTHAYSFANSMDSKYQYQRPTTPVCELDITSLIASPD